MGCWTQNENVVIGKNDLRDQKMILCLAIPQKDRFTPFIWVITVLPFQVSNSLHLWIREPEWSCSFLPRRWRRTDHTFAWRNEFGNIFFNLVTFHRKLLKYSGVLNSKIVRCSDHGDLFARPMVCYSDAGYHGSSVFRSQFGLRTGI